MDGRGGHIFDENMKYISKDKLRLSRKLGDRILICIFCSVLIVILGCFALGLHSWKVNTLSDQIIKICIFEIFFSFLLFSILGFLWGLAAPKWLEKILRKQSGKILLFIQSIAVGTILTIIYFILIGI